jgi:predicted small secreted protein
MRAASIIVAVLTLGLLASCNTVRGAGQDVRAAGAAVENAATSVKDDIQNDDGKTTPQR